MCTAFYGSNHLEFVFPTLMTYFRHVQKPIMLKQNRLYVGTQTKECSRTSLVVPF